MREDLGGKGVLKSDIEVWLVEEKAEVFFGWKKIWMKRY